MKQSFPLSNPGTHVEVNGLRMYYESHGEGIPVVLLHGGFETCRMWAPVVAALSRYYRVITPDSHGHGRTDAPAEPVTFPRMVEGASLAVIPNADHMTMAAQFDLAVEVLSSFMQRLIGRE